MEIQFKKEWQFVGTDKLIAKTHELLTETYNEIEPIWRGMMESVFNQILDSYYSYIPTMNMPFRRESLYNGYTFTLSRHGGTTEQEDKFTASGHWSISGSPNFSDDAIIMYVMMGNRSVPPWVLTKTTPRTYTAYVRIPEIGFSMIGFPPDIWEAADAAVVEYIEGQIADILVAKMVNEFLDNVQEYYI